MEYCCCCCSVAQSCPTLCNTMDCNTPGLPVPHHLLEFVQVHVHCIGDAIQPSHPLTSSSPSALNLSQLQGLSNESAICNGILLSHKKNEIMPFAATWMDLEIIILSETKNVRKRKINTLLYHLHMEKKCGTNELIYETETESWT